MALDQNPYYIQRRGLQYINPGNFNYQIGQMGGAGNVTPNYSMVGSGTSIPGIQNETQMGFGNTANAIVPLLQSPQVEEYSNTEWNELGSVGSDEVGNAARGIGNAALSSGNPYLMAGGFALNQLSNLRDKINYNPNPEELTNTYSSQQKETFDLGDERSQAMYMGSNEQLRGLGPKLKDSLFMPIPSLLLSNRNQSRARDARREMLQQISLARGRFNKSNIAFDKNQSMQALHQARLGTI